MSETASHPMQIRLAAPDDLPQLLAIYARARAFMSSHGNPRQWAARGWPPEELIRQDIARRKSYVCVTDHVAGVFYFDVGPDIEPTYRVIRDGRWLSDTPYGVVHRIAADGTARGIGARCIDWAFEQCGHLRIDTHPDNTVMQNLLGKLGFTRCGIISIVEDDDPRLAYEKISGSVAT